MLVAKEALTPLPPRLFLEIALAGEGNRSGMAASMAFLLVPSPMESILRKECFPWERARVRVLRSPVQKYNSNALMRSKYSCRRKNA
jgi:hypothetical protein